VDIGRRDYSQFLNFNEIDAIDMLICMLQLNLQVRATVLFMAAVGMFRMIIGMAFKFKEMNLLQMAVTKMQFRLNSKRAKGIKTQKKIKTEFSHVQM
jgi:hypothetical protein